MSNSSVGSSGQGVPKGITLSSTLQSEVAPCLPLPSLPVFCGALVQEIRLLEDGGESARRNSSRNVSAKIAELLRNADVSYLNLKDNGNLQPDDSVRNFQLFNDVLRHEAEAFDFTTPGPAKESLDRGKLTELRPVERNVPSINRASSDPGGAKHDANVPNDAISSSRKPKVKRKEKDAPAVPHFREHQDA